MPGMTPRQRVMSAISHREPDRVPVSLGGTAHKITDSLFHKMRQHFGICGEPARVLTGIRFSYYDDRLLDALGTDTRFLHLGQPEHYKRQVHADGSYVNEWGVTFRDEDHFTAVVANPLREATVSDLERYSWPAVREPRRIAGLRERARGLYEDTDYAIVAYRPVPCGLFEMACMLRGTSEFLVDMFCNKTFAGALLDKILDISLDLYRLQLDVVGPYVQIVEMLDDYGSQGGLLFSPELYRELLEPRQRLLVTLIRDMAPQAKIMFHSCGAIEPLINDFISTGFDILNPLQPGAVGMKPADLKRAYGDRICFLGGIDVQQTLRGDRQGVAREVCECIKALAPGGGYVLAPSHNLFEDVPLDNVLCMLETVRSAGHYPIDARGHRKRCIAAKARRS